MPKMVFVEKNGTRKEVDAPVGLSVLEIAHRNNIDLEGACEGSLACSTCHVIVDGECTSTAWLTLGKGLLPQSITTDAEGTGRAALFRSVAAFPVGSEFDIHFRVINEETSEVVLTSECYQFTISQ